MHYGMSAEEINVKSESMREIDQLIRTKRKQESELSTTYPKCQLIYSAYNENSGFDVSGDCSRNLDLVLHR